MWFAGLRAVRRDERGAVSIIAAASGATLLGFGALAVDMGSIFLQSRQLQGMADLAAMAAARDLPNAQAAAQATASNNGWDGSVDATVVTGTYKTDPAVDAANRFTPGGPEPDAARVTLSAEVDLVFGAALLGRPTTTVSRTATAAKADLAGFSIGSRLASLNGGVANSLLGQLTGSNVSLTVNDYNALATAEVDLLSFAKALQTDASAQTLSFDKVLEHNISTGKALSVMADELQAKGDANAATAMRKLATAAGTGTQAKLVELFDLGPYGKQDHVAGASGAGVKIAAMDMASAMLTAGKGGHQLELDLGASVPGLTSTRVYLGIGDRAATSPWITVTRDKSVVVRTAQTRLYIDTRLGTSGLLNLAGVGSLRLPLLVEAAPSQAKISTLSCPLDRPSRSAQLAVLPSIGAVSIADIDTTNLSNFRSALNKSPAVLANAGLIKITGSATGTVGGGTWKTASFTQAEVDAATVKTVSTDDAAQALTSSLLGSLNVGVTVGGFLGLGVNAATLGNAVTGVVGTAATPLDTVINTLTQLAGVRLGQADVRVNGLRCGEAALVA